MWLFIDGTGTYMTENRMREKGRDLQQRAPRPGLECGAAAAKRQSLCIWIARSTNRGKRRPEFVYFIMS